MENERGLLLGGHKLADAINDILLQSPVDNIVIPNGTRLDEMAWQFSGDIFPTRIVDCTRDQFIKIVEALTSEISKIQKVNIHLAQKYENATGKRISNGIEYTDQQYNSILERHK